ncbi:hypothetical protein [Actinoplanes sp. NPDC049681]|uniref:hypothetical protein n=1 Tax=Actinoplanes sp. NPDC049681 TaxID=3363905 RepID=UPI00378C5493
MQDNEERDLRKLLSLLDKVDAWREMTDRPGAAWQVQPGSPLAGDDAKADPYQVSHSAWHALTVAVDHMQCLRSSLVSELTDRSASIRIHTHAQSSLIRGAFENGARAVWMLGPPMRLARVTRRLSLEAKEVRHSARMRELVGQPGPRTVEQRERQLRDLIINAGVQPDDARRALRSPQYSESVKAAGELTTLGADLAEVVWSGCSSLAHGDISGTLGLLDKEIVERVGDVNHVRITGSVSGLYLCTLASFAVINSGFDLFKARSSAPHGLR